MAKRQSAAIPGEGLNICDNAHFQSSLAANRNHIDKIDMNQVRIFAPSARRVVFLLLFLLISSVTFAQDNISLAGQWSVALDSLSQGESLGYATKLDGLPIDLPGSLDEARIGRKTTENDFGILTRRYKYYGKAWYTRQINVPEEWKDREVNLMLERVMWESKVYVDGRAVSAESSLGTPHIHRLGKLTPGEHTLAVRVDNDQIWNIGDKGHAYTEYTQTIWNGIVGRIELEASEPVSVDGLDIWSDYEAKTVRFTHRVQNGASEKKARLTYQITDNQTGEVIYRDQAQVNVPAGLSEHAFATPALPEVKPWNEFTPNLYTASVVIEEKETAVTFGFRDMGTTRSKVTVNGVPVFLRGNLDCVHFPLTGYPSCDVEEWERIFRIYKDHGLNMVRFHSWCPPEAAFTAADRLGIYIQAEVLWIDWWMTNPPEDRPEMYTKGLPEGLGKNESADAYVQMELKNMVRAYGNHPSFAFMCIGNELGNSDFEVMQRWIDAIKQKDGRRLYSVSTARQITPVDEYMVTHHIPGVGGTYALPPDGTDFDLESNYSKADLPILAHELGQMPVFPLWSEIDKYTGVVEARNLERMYTNSRYREMEGLDEMGNDNSMWYDSLFHYASGKTQNMIYKAHIETLLRTPSCAGYQLLSMTDYAGQGEALVGWLDSFWDSKGTLDPEEFRQYGAAVVPLCRFGTYVWPNDTVFFATVQVSNYSLQNIDGRIGWRVADEGGKVVGKGTVACHAPLGELTTVGDIRLPLRSVKEARKLTLSVGIEGTDYRNSWDFWVYPAKQKTPSGVTILTRLDEEALDRIEAGENVLLIANELGLQEDYQSIFFSPLFWSNTFFPGQANKTLGFSIDASHPAFEHFPTETFGSWQWQSISKGRIFNLNYWGIHPIVQPISDFHINDVLGTIFEFRIGEAGKVLVCSHDILGKDDPVAKQLLTSLIRYMQSDRFDPDARIGREYVQQIFIFDPAPEKVKSAEFPDAQLILNCGTAAPEGSINWTRDSDELFRVSDDYDYHVTAARLSPNGWLGTGVRFELTVPKGVIGDLYVRIEGLATVWVEGRRYTVDASGEPTFVKLFIMREDTGDGKVKIGVEDGGNGEVTVSRIVLETR